ncbi:MAG TPA: hypothetical protein VEU51_00330 [Candidatus Acidoferrales bacterium]|nr:hypothetical protein [Candidatus Acidoferrales bacterium]
MPETESPATVQGNATAAAPTSTPGSWSSRIGAALLRRLLIVCVLAVLVMIGLFLANMNPTRARFYWSAMFPVFGIVSIWHELQRSNRDDGSGWRMIVRQLLHWLGPIVAVRIIFLQLSRGQMDADADALATLLILAVTCFLAGVHLDRSFFWVSVVLAIAVVIGTEVEAYLWMLAAVAAVALALAVLAAIALRRRRGTAM